MKQTSINKIYENLSNKELANLVFNTIPSKNTQKIDKLVSLVPIKKYSCVDFEYRDHLDRILRMAYTWSIWHWQLKSELNAKFSVWLMRVIVAEESISTTLEDYQECESRLLALDLALDEICSKNGIDASTVRKLANTEPFCEADSKLVFDEEFKIEIEDKLSGLL